METLNPVKAIVPPELKAAQPAIEVAKTVYPAVEELTFRAYVANEEQALELLKSVQAIVNAVGGVTIIQIVKAIEKNPKMLQTAMTYLPLIMKG